MLLSVLSEHSWRRWTSETGRMQFVLVLPHQLHWCRTEVKQAWLEESFLCWHFLHFNKQGWGSGFGEGAVGLRQYGKRVWHLISIMNQWNISLLRHTVVQWREWCVLILSPATILGPVTIKWPNTRTCTHKIHTAACTQQHKLNLVPQRA